MSWMFVLLLTIVGCTFGVPIVRQEFQFELIDCQIGENETSSYHILQIKDLNETCLQINKTTSSGSEIIYYIFQETQITDLIEIKTNDCSAPTPDFYIMKCDEDDNSTESTFIVENSNLTSNYSLNENSTISYFAQTFLETISGLNEDENTTNPSSTNQQQNSDESSEDD